jgi:hypothetical protein
MVEHDETRPRAPGPQKETKAEVRVVGLTGERLWKEAGLLSRCSHVVTRMFVASLCVAKGTARVERGQR